MDLHEFDAWVRRRLVVTALVAAWLLLLVALVVAATAAWGHGSYQWIADGGYRTMEPDPSWIERHRETNGACCGVDDCPEIDPGSLRSEGEWWYGTIDGGEPVKWHRRNVYVSEDSFEYGCSYRKYPGTPGDRFEDVGRCLFIQPRGF